MKTTKELIIADITAKVEAKLANQKVELASLQGVIKLDDAAFKLKDKSLAVTQKVKESLSIAISNLGQTVSAFEKVIAEVNALEKSAKDLGIALPNDARISRDSASREISQNNDLKNKLSSLKF